MREGCWGGVREGCCGKCDEAEEGDERQGTYLFFSASFWRLVGSTELLLLVSLIVGREDLRGVDIFSIRR